MKEYTFYLSNNKSNITHYSLECDCTATALDHATNLIGKTFQGLIVTNVEIYIGEELQCGIIKLH